MWRWESRVERANPRKRKSYPLRRALLLSNVVDSIANKSSY